MGDEIVNIKGLSELQTALEEMGIKVARQGLRKALKSGASPIQEGMAVLAPKDTGLMSENFNTKIRIGRDELSGSAFIGPNGKIDYPFYASGAYRVFRNAKGKMRKVGKMAVATVVRFFEFGTSKMAKKPFMTQAFESNKNAALALITNSLADTVAKAAAAAPKGPAA